MFIREKCESTMQREYTTKYETSSPNMKAVMLSFACQRSQICCWSRHTRHILACWYGQHSMYATRV